MKRKLFGFILIIFSLLIAASPALAHLNLLAPLSPIIVEPYWSFETNQAYDTSLDHREMAVAADCDIDGDGYQDLLVGKRDYNSTDLDNGRVWLFYGSADGLSATPSRIFDPPYPNMYGFFGTEVACANVNGDEYDDILVGMDNYDSAYSDEGAVFVWYGAEEGPTTSYNWMARGDNTYAHFGFSLDNAGDVNGDGYEDIIVGAWRSDYNVIAHAYVWFGGSLGLGDYGTPANADWVGSDPYPAIPTGSGYGRLVRGIGDVNHDTYADVLVGAFSYDGAVVNQGAVFVYYGSDLGPNEGVAGTVANADWMAVSGQSDSRFAMQGADGVGDLNNDGIDDLALGAYLYDNPEVNEGAVFVWYGGEVAVGLGENGTPANADWTAETNMTGDYLGFAVRPAGDINHDEIDDLIVTAYGFDAPGETEPISGAGAWFVWYGGTGGPGENGTPANADLAGYGKQASGILGFDDCSVGDMDGDGTKDIFVLSLYYTNPEASEGAVFGYEHVTNTPPTIDLISPSSDVSIVQGDNVLIEWMDADPDNNAEVSLAYDTDNDPSNGGYSWIALALSEDSDGTGDQYTWNTSGVVVGTYYIWGMIYDEVNPEVYDIAIGRVTITNFRSYLPMFAK